MEWFQMILDALNAGVDGIFSVAGPVAVLWATFFVAVLRKEILSGIPAIFRAVVAMVLDKALMPVVLNAVRSAEEYGARAAKKGVEELGRQLGAEKLAAAKRYVTSRVPDWIVTDAQLEQMIDAALVVIGRGATKGIEFGVEFVEKKIASAVPPQA